MKKHLTIVIKLGMHDQSQHCLLREALFDTFQVLPP